MSRVSSDGLNRSAEIRKFFELNPGAGIRDCISDLSSRGVEVSYGLVASVRSRDRVREEVSEGDLERVRDFVRVSNLDSEVAVRILRDFVKLVQVVGGLDRFLHILDKVGEPVSASSYYDVNEDED